MKTIYTDETGAMPWLWLVAGTLLILSNAVQLEKSFDLLNALGFLAGLVFCGLAIKRFIQIRRAKAEGRDHTIVRVKNAPDR